MKKVIVTLKYDGPRYPFGKEAERVVFEIEWDLRCHEFCMIDISTPTQYLAADLWCKKQGYKMETYFDGRPISTKDAHQLLNKEYITLETVAIDHLISPFGDDE